MLLGKGDPWEGKPWKGEHWEGGRIGRGEHHNLQHTAVQQPKDSL